LAQYFAVHPTHPQARLLRRAAEIVRGGGLIAYPTDSCYALGCHLGDAAAQQADAMKFANPLPRKRGLAMIQ